MSHPEQNGSEPAILWPYVVFPPLLPAVAASALAIGMAQHAHYPVFSNIVLALLATYLALGVPCLLLGLLHRRIYRNEGRHRLWPVLGLAAVLSVAGWGVLMVLARQTPTDKEFGQMALLSLGGMVSLAVVGYGAVRLIDAWSRAGQGHKQ